MAHILRSMEEETEVGKGVEPPQSPDEQAPAPLEPKTAGPLELNPKKDERPARTYVPL